MFVLSDRPEYRVPAEPESEAARRILDILPFLTSKARRWLRGLPEPARRRLDVEDAMQEVWAALLASDRYFDPARGAYITFAAIVADRHLGDLARRLHRDRCRKPLTSIRATPASTRPTNRP